MLIEQVACFTHNTFLMAERTALPAGLDDVLHEAAATFVDGTGQIVEGARQKLFPFPFYHKREAVCS